MSNWSLLKVPTFCERLIGFSVPRQERLLVVSYEGLHLLHLASSITVETHEEFAEYALYDPDPGTVEFHGEVYDIVGLHGGFPILTAPQGERLVLDTQRQTIELRQGNRTTFATQYENFSGDWAAATFSADGLYIVFGGPYDFDFRIWKRAAVA